MLNPARLLTVTLEDSNPDERIALLRARLAYPPDTRSDYDLNPGMRTEAPPVGSLTQAAVLVPIIGHESSPTVLLTKRTDHLRDHAGQVSFPGGRVEVIDDGPNDTALRETEEEIGLHRNHVEIVGQLADYETRTGFNVTPIVGYVQPGFNLKLDSFEVAAAFEIPLKFVLDPRNHQTRSRVWRGTQRYFYAMEYEDYVVWGATAGMLVNLYHRMLQGTG